MVDVKRTLELLRKVIEELKELGCPVENAGNTINLYKEFDPKLEELKKSFEDLEDLSEDLRKLALKTFCQESDINSLKSFSVLMTSDEYASQISDMSHLFLGTKAYYEQLLRGPDQPKAHNDSYAEEIVDDTKLHQFTSTVSPVLQGFDASNHVFGASPIAEKTFSDPEKGIKSMQQGQPFDLSQNDWRRI